MIAGILTKNLEITENIAILKSIGYDGFQFDLSDFGINTLKKGFIPDSETDKCIQKISKISQKMKFPIFAIHTFYPLNAEDEIVIKTFKKYLEYLKLIKCNHLILHISGYLEDKEKLKQAIICLNKIKRIYDDQGFEILLENDHPPSLFITAEDIERITSKLKLNLCFDTAHALQSDLNLDEFYFKLERKIQAIHLSDFSEGKTHLEIGTGVIKQFNCFKEIIQANKLLILEVGGSLLEAKSKKDIVKIYKNSFLEATNL